MDNLGSTLFWLALFGYLAVSEWLDSRGTSQRKQSAFDAQKMLLDRFQSNEELNQFLSTEAGRKFVESLGDGGRTAAFNLKPATVFIALMILAVVGVSLGATFYLLAIQTQRPDFLAPAIVTAVPSVGLLLGSALGYVLMRRKESNAAESGSRAG